MLRRALLRGAIALPLAGCRPGIDVLVSGDPVRPTFTFRRLGRRIEFSGEVRIYQSPSGAPIWRIKTTPTSHLEYGRVDDRVVEQVRAKPLEPGQVYVAVARSDSQGYYGATTFGIHDGKLEVASGSGDPPIADINRRLGVPQAGP